MLCAIAPIAAALAPPASAAVRLTSVSSGTAAISQRGAVTDIRTSNNAILNFSQFDIAAGSTVNFIQPTASSRELDHINSAAPSMINGSLLSNGTVYLVNPAGVIFGPGSVVNVNAIYASGSYMSNQDFLNKNDHFSGISGMVSNSGTIHANQVYLIGTQVLNQGSIIAPGGLVAMVSGSDVLVSEQDSHVVAKVVPIAAPVSSSGGSAGQSDLRTSAMAAGDVYSLAIKHTGSIQAANVMINGGGGQVQVSGSIDASSSAAGTTGGTVSITGGEVELLAANINASGPAGGGSVYIGGEEHGGGDLDQAQNVSADSNTTINADATGNGAGGTVVLWSTDTTNTAAAITARGGPTGGNGGFIETSGDYLQVSGTAPNAGAPHGEPGTWLLDPINITIVPGSVTPGVFTGPTVGATDIESALEADTSVTIQTNNQNVAGNTGTLTQDANATIDVTLANAGPVTLTMQANDNMTLSGGITVEPASTSTLNVELDQLNSASSAVTINTLPININGALTILGGNVSSSVGITALSVKMASGTTTIGATAVTTGSINISGAIVAGEGGFIGDGTSFTTTTGGTISTSLANGGVSIQPSGAVSLGAAVSSGTGDILVGGTTFTTTAGGTITATGAATVTIQSTSAISIGGAISTGTGLLSVGGSSITTTTGATITSAGGPVTLTPTTSISLAAAVSTGGGEFTGGGTSFTTTAGGTLTTGGGEVKIDPTGAISIGDVVDTGGGPFVATGTSFTDNAEIEDGGAGTTAGTLSVNTTSGGSLGSITVTAPLLWSFATGRAVVLEAGGSLTIAATGSISAASGAALPISLYSTNSGDVTVNGIISTTGAFVAAGGNFTVGSPNTTPPPTIIAASSVSINTATVATNGDSAALTNLGVSISGPVVSTGGITIGGTTSLTTGQNGTLTSTGTISITNTGAVTIDAPVNTGGGALTATMCTSFTTGATSTVTLGTISTTGGSITISNSLDSTVVTIGEAVNTGGGAFTVTGESFTNSALISDDGVATGSNAFSVNTSSGTADIDINAAISWTGGTGRSVLLESGGNIDIAATGSISENPVNSNPLPISFYTTSSTGNITLDGIVSTSNGAFIASGGNFIIGAPSATPAPTILTATTANIETATMTPDSKLLTPGSVNIAGPVVTSGALTIGGTAEYTQNQSGSITTHGGAYVINNSGEISIGAAVNTGGGAFEALNAVEFTNESNGTINTGGGTVTIVTNSSEGVQLNAAVDTGGGGFVVSTEAFSNTGEITDDGVALANGAFSIITPAGASSPSTFSIGGAISWTGGTGRSISIIGGSDILITAPITSTGTTPLPVRIDTSGEPNETTGTASQVTINAPIDISGSLTTDGGNFTLSTNANAGSDGSVTALSFLLNTNNTTPQGLGVFAGAAIIEGPIVTHGAVTLFADTITQNGNGSITSNGGAVAMTAGEGLITVGSPIITGGGEFFASAGSTMSPSGGTFTSAGSGTIATNGGAVNITSTDTLEIGAEISTGGGNFVTNSPAFELTAGTTVTDGGVNNSNSNGFVITVPNNAIDIDGIINWAASHSPLTFNYGPSFGIVLTGQIIVNPAEPLNFANTVLALNGGNATLTGGNITLGTVIANPQAQALSPLTIQSSGTVVLGGNIGLPTTNQPDAPPIGTLTITGNNSPPPTTSLNGTIASFGDVVFGGPLQLAGNSAIEGETYQGETNTTEKVEFDGAVEGPAGISVFMPGAEGDTIRINNDVGNNTPVAFMNLFPGQDGLVGIRWGTADLPPGVLQQQPLTTINIAAGGTFGVNDESSSPRNFSSIDSTIDSYGPLTINVGAGQAANSGSMYKVGVNEKLAVYGALDINVNGGTIATGDISTTGNLTLDAPTIHFVLRGPTTLGENNIVDSGMDLISLAQISLPANAAYAGIKESNGEGAIDDPGFVANSFNPTSDIGHIAGQLGTAYSFIGVFPASTLFGTDNLLIDYSPSTFTSSSIPTFVPPIPFVYDYPIAGAFPQQLTNAGNVPLDFKTAFQAVYPGPIEQENLKDTGVYSRDPTTDEIVGAVGTLAVYNDMPQKPRPKSVDYRAAAPRLDSVEVKLFVKAYHQTFGADPEARKAQMAQDFQAAWDGYVTQAGGQGVSGAGFTQYCATTPAAAGAYADLAALRELRGHLATLGLSYKEAQVAFQYNMLAGMRANGMRSGDLAEAVANTGGK